MWFRSKDAQREKFERLAEPAYPSIYGMALRLTHDREDAHDLAQEALVRAYEAFDRFDGRNFKAWMLRILTNLYINKYRRNRRGPGTLSMDEENFMEPAGSESDIPDRQVIETLFGSEVEQALAKVPVDFRTAVLLSDVEGFSYEEIAEATQVPIGTVRSRIARGRAILRRELELFAEQEGYLRKSKADE
ncbi:MAG: sigma-70 family RNA polymerase sigma factor [Chthonomonas sp.]|nr:sigma-70 family RNA polymerase sigma factor [Chthonomonas sp.]